MSTIVRSTLIAAIALSAFATSASAQYRGQNPDSNQGQGYGFARVINSQPIYETVEVDDGREVCRNEQVRIPQYAQQ